MRSRLICLIICLMLISVGRADDMNAMALPSVEQQGVIQSPSMQATDDFVENLKKVGMTFEQAGGNLNVTINQPIAFSAVPMLQSLGALNAKVSQATMNAHPATYAGVISMYSMVLILPYVYKNSFIDQIQVNVYVEAPNNTGNMQKALMMAFGFNRQLYQKINWDHLPPQNLLTLGLHFQFAKWYEDRLAAE